MPITTAYALASSGDHGDDRIAVLEHDGTTIIVVADGVGGMSGGALAAEMLVEICAHASGWCVTSRGIRSQESP